MAKRLPPTLFDVGRDEMLDAGEQENFAAPLARVQFIAGMLSAWTLGDVKPTLSERQWFIDVAREALDKANVRRRNG